MRRKFSSKIRLKSKILYTRFSNFIIFLLNYLLEFNILFLKNMIISYSFFLSKKEVLN